MVLVSLDAQRQRLRLDFSGTSPQRPSNFNAPLAVTRAAVLYVIRCLLDSDIPLNEGCFAPLDLVVPEGCLLNPRSPAAVVAGNVEVSQALCNLLLAAFGAQAAGQGTMNNVSFGNGRCQYYETVAGGGGAGEGFAGSVGLQSHMTNSRLTDPEVLESRYPVRLETFAVRAGSGGQGRWPGGDGLERTIRFLEPMSVSLISGSRQVPPFGLNGGANGACGVNLRVDCDGAEHPLPGSVQLELQKLARPSAYSLQEEEAWEVEGLPDACAMQMFPGLEDADLLFVLSDDFVDVVDSFNGHESCRLRLFDGGDLMAATSTCNSGVENDYRSCLFVQKEHL